MACVEKEALAAWVDGSVLPEDARRIEAHVASCAQCREAAAALRGTAEWLGALARKPDPQFAARLTLEKRPKKSALWPIALAAAVVLISSAWFVTQRDDEFTPRGGNAHALRELVGVEVFADKTLLRGGEKLDGRALTFVVTNRSKRELHLALFAIDSHGDAHWFYPAFTDATQNPTSISISTQPVQALSDAVSPENVAPGALKIVALFTTRPRTVRELEAALPAVEGDVVQTLSLSAP